MNPVFIDPRGYFGHTELYGDPNYDWAKLYYSVVGNYDRFNLKKFRLSVNEHNVELDIQSNGWEHLEDYFFELIGDDVNHDYIKLIQYGFPLRRMRGKIMIPSAEHSITDFGISRMYLLNILKVQRSLTRPRLILRLKKLSE